MDDFLDFDFTQEQLFVIDNLERSNFSITCEISESDKVKYSTCEKTWTYFVGFSRNLTKVQEEFTKGCYDYESETG